MRRPVPARIADLHFGLWKRHTLIRISALSVPGLQELSQQQHHHLVGVRDFSVCTGRGFWLTPHLDITLETGITTDLMESCCCNIVEHNSNLVQLYNERKTSWETRNIVPPLFRVAYETVCKTDEPIDLAVLEYCCPTWVTSVNN